MEILNVTNISHAYQNKDFFKRKRLPVLDDISFSIEEGQCFTILGASGAGKSTIAKIILGIEKPSFGQVTFLGEDLYTSKSTIMHQLRRDLQVVFQDSFSAVNPRMTAEQIIAEPLNNFEKLGKNEKRVYIIDLLQQVGLDESDLNKYPHEFSGGQLQRINIARALALKPKLLVLDEPISSLDMVNQLKIIELLKQLKNDLQLTYIFITHDIKAACLLSDEITILDNGRLVAYYENVEQFINSSNPVALKLKYCMLAEHPRQRTIR